jgi:predicted small lipoprotein YifL
MARIRTAPTTGKLLVRIVLVILVLALAGCGLVELRTSEKNAVGSGTTQVGNPDEASQALQQLEVTPPGSMSGYSRESFDHWSRANDFGWDAPESSCDAREAALIRDGENVEVGSGCKVTSGKWHDPYTDQTFTDPSDIDTDHIVALGNAWRSGPPRGTTPSVNATPTTRRFCSASRTTLTSPRGTRGRRHGSPQRGRVVRFRRALDLDQGQVRSEHQPRGEGSANADAGRLRGG